MTLSCPAPDESLGIALRLSGYLDCQARALGENGFEAMARGPIASGILTGAVTIFVALIGYRMILGTRPTAQDGVGWAVRLGLVLALSSSWPAFQILVFRVAVDGPQDIASVILPAIGLPTEGVDARVQTAYEAIGRGSYVEATLPASTQAVATPNIPLSASAAIMGLPPAPVAASLLILSTVGVSAALKLAIGFLVALGPLAMIALLFDSTRGVVASWARTMLGAALGVLATRITGALELICLESEITRTVDIRAGAASLGSADLQGFMTVVSLFAIIALVAIGASFRAASGIRLYQGAWASAIRAPSIRLANLLSGLRDLSPQSRSRPAVTMQPFQTRAAAVSEALATAARRGMNSVDSHLNRNGRQTEPVGDQAPGATNGSVKSIGRTGRRTSVRRSRLALRRDILA